MWDWINCHLAGRHEYVVWTNSNRVFLRCLRCGRRSNGWHVAENEPQRREAAETREAKPARHRLLGALRLG